MITIRSTATAAVVLSTLTACTPASHSSPDRSEPRATPSPTSTPTSAVVEETDSAVNAYRNMWLDYAEAAATSDWQSSKLGEHATGVALSTLTRGLYGDHYRGVITRGRPTLAPSVSSAEPPQEPIRVVVSDCGDSTNWTRHYADSGDSADDEPEGRRHIDAVIEKQADGTWKVTEFGVQEVGTC